MGRLVNSEANINAASGKILTTEMKILGKSVYRGPHLHSHTPMIRVELDIGRLEEWPTNKIRGFSQALLTLIPSLQEHGCSYGTPGGFVKRMEEGTWIGHVIEHVALELQVMAGANVARGKTRSVKGKPGVYNVMFAYENERAGLYAARFALELVSSLLPEGLAGIAGMGYLPGDAEPLFTTVDDAVDTIRRVARRSQLGPTTAAIVAAAKARDIPAMRLDDHSLVQLGWGRNQRRIRGSISESTSHIAVETASDKALTKKMLLAAGVPAPEGDVAYDIDEALQIAHEIGYPVVMKPLDGNHGRGVTTNILNDGQARTAFATASAEGRAVIVEQYYAGSDYRILVIDGKLSAVSERIPAHVTGDGIHSVAELIDILNSDPQRGDGHEAALSKVIMNPKCEQFLARTGFSLCTVPAKGKKVQLCDTANLSTGGTAIDRTDDIHPSNIMLMERAAKAIGLDIAGIDVVAKDISQPLVGQGGVVEINASPGFRMHLHPAQGKPRAVGEDVISMMFPDNAPGRIPLIAITGTNGKSTTTRMITHILRQTGKNVGFTSTGGIYMNDSLVWAGDASGPQSARRILQNRDVDYAVLETARGGILREGLAFDVCDVGAVLNVTEDHLGLGGMDTLQDLAAVKSVVAESVSGRGVCVLNADDPMTLEMSDVAGGRICFFSMRSGAEMSDVVRHHIEQGGMAILHEESQIVFYDGESRSVIMSVKQIPATLDGFAGFNVQNALAAAAIAISVGIDHDTIRQGLSSFASSYEQNPGRVNIHDGHGFRIIMDYAHNPAGLSAFLDMTNKMRPNYGRVIGTVSTPGDRRDEDIREMGRIAASGFDFLVFREDPDRRGRPPGEVLRLLSEGAISAGFPIENLVGVGPEEEALGICLQQAEPGDLVLLSPTTIGNTWQTILDFRPKPRSKTGAVKDSIALYG